MKIGDSVGDCDGFMALYLDLFMITTGMGCFFTLDADDRDNDGIDTE